MRGSDVDRYGTRYACNPAFGQLRAIRTIIGRLLAKIGAEALEVTCLRQGGLR
jgi:hypothetical protein